MPSRVIRGEINRSASLARVSLEAELTFDRLITAVDDYGRLDARPEALKADLFPMRAEVKPAQVRRWVEELAEGDDAPVVLYRVGGRDYLALVNWERHRGTSKRSGKSRYPEPPETSRGNPGKSGEAPEILKSPSESRESRVEGMESRVSPGKPATPSWATDLSSLLVQKVAAVPGARIPPRAVAAWAAEIARLPAEVPELCANGKEPAEHIRAAIEWAFGPENLGIGKYEVVIRSGGALREKWSQLVEAAKRRRAKPEGEKKREEMDEWVRTGRV